MSDKFKLIPLDILASVLTLLGSVFHFVGFFAAPWWVHDGREGHSFFGMTSHRMCEVGCRAKSVLDINGGTEWIFAVRVFEVFGVICALFALIFAILVLVVRKKWIFAVRVFEVFGVICALFALIFAVLVLVVRKKVVHTSLIYLLGAGALFILVGVFLFLGCKSSLEKRLDGESSLMYTFALCLVGALICIAAAVVGGVTLRKHLLDMDFDDDEYD